MLAEKLGRTKAELLASLSGLEYLEWTVFYQLRAQQEQLEYLKTR